MMKPFDLRDIDSRVVEVMSLRRCNTFTGKALAGSRPSGDLSADLIQQLSYTLEHIRHTSMLDDNLKQSFRRHQEKLKELLKSRMETSNVPGESSHCEPPAEDCGLNENKSATRGKLRSTIHKTDFSPKDTAADPPEVAAGMKMQRLMQDQKDHASKELEYHQQNKTKLLSELSQLTTALKDSTLSMNKSIKMQNMQLSSIHVHASENKTSLDEQKRKMTQQTQSMATSLWTSVSIMLAVLGLFMLTYITIRLLPSPPPSAHRRRTCRSPGPVQLVQPPEDLSVYDRLLGQYEDNTPGEAPHRVVVDIDTCLEASCHVEMTSIDQALIQEEGAALSETHAHAEITTTDGLGHDATVMSSSSSSVEEQSMVASDEQSMVASDEQSLVASDEQSLVASDEQSMVASDEHHCTTAVDFMECSQQDLRVEDGNANITPEPDRESSSDNSAFLLGSDSAATTHRHLFLAADEEDVDSTGGPSDLQDPIVAD